jgi:hypothetical protein
MENDTEEESVPTESEEAETPDSGEAIEPAPVEEARGAPTVLAALRRGGGVGEAAAAAAGEAASCGPWASSR